MLWKQTNKQSRPFCTNSKVLARVKQLLSAYYESCLVRKFPAAVQYTSCLQPPQSVILRGCFESLVYEQTEIASLFCVDSGDEKEMWSLFLIFLLCINFCLLWKMVQVFLCRYLFLLPKKKFWKLLDHHVKVWLGPCLAPSTYLLGKVVSFLPRVINYFQMSQISHFQVWFPRWGTVRETSFPHI